MRYASILQTVTSALIILCALCIALFIFFDGHTRHASAQSFASDPVPGGMCRCQGCNCFMEEGLEEPVVVLDTNVLASVLSEKQVAAAAIGTSKSEGTIPSPPKAKTSSVSSGPSGPTTRSSVKNPSSPTRATLSSPSSSGSTSRTSSGSSGSTSRVSPSSSSGSTSKVSSSSRDDDEYSSPSGPTTRSSVRNPDSPSRASLNTSSGPTGPTTRSSARNPNSSGAWRRYVTGETDSARPANSVSGSWWPSGSSSSSSDDDDEYSGPSGPTSRSSVRNPNSPSRDELNTSSGPTGPTTRSSVRNPDSPSRDDLNTSSGPTGPNTRSSARNPNSSGAWRSYVTGLRNGNYSYESEEGRSQSDEDNSSTRSRNETAIEALEQFQRSSSNSRRSSRYVMPYFNLDRDARLVAPTIDESAYDPDAADTPGRFNSWPSDRLQPDPPVERNTDNSDYYHGYDLEPSRPNGEVRIIPTESKTEAVRRAQRARHDNGFYYEYRDEDGSVGYVDDGGFVLEKDD